MARGCVRDRDRRRPYSLGPAGSGDGSFVRVQCKTGVLHGGSVVFRVYSVSGHGGVGIPYHGQIDAFGVFCPANRGTYLVPVHLASDFFIR